jgi:hypothetical protein
MSAVFFTNAKKKVISIPCVDRRVGGMIFLKACGGREGVFERNKYAQKRVGFKNQKLDEVTLYSYEARSSNVSA